MTWLDNSILFAISLIANIFSAFAGGGAGLIQLPAIIFMGLPFGVALATHKIASVFLGIGATFRNLKENRLKRQFAIFTLLTGLPGVVIGANVILTIDDHIAQIALGVLTISLGIYSRLKPSLGQTLKETNRDNKGFIVGGLMIFIIGVLNGSLTSGTGLFVTLWLVRWFGLDYKTAVSYTLILVGLFWNGAGAITLGFATDIAWQWLPALILGSLLGGYIGAHLAITQGNRWIKVIYEVITISVGIKLIIG